MGREEVDGRAGKKSRRMQGGVGGEGAGGGGREVCRLAVGENEARGVRGGKSVSGRGGRGGVRGRGRPKGCAANTGSARRGAVADEKRVDMKQECEAEGVDGAEGMIDVGYEEGIEGHDACEREKLVCVQCVCMHVGARARAGVYEGACARARASESIHISICGV